MSEEKSTMEELYASTLKDIKEGEVTKGTIAAITPKEVIVDIGFKSEGFVPIEEFRDPTLLVIGSAIEVLIENIEDDNGRLILSFAKAERIKGWQKISDDINEGDVLEGKVTRTVKGGYIVDVFGIEAFLPMSLSAFKGISSHDITTHTYKFVVAKMNKQRRNLILSRREMVQKEREEIRQRLWGELKKGQKRRGVVKGITDFGAFIDLGGVDGLLHITDISWSRINHPSEIVSVGQKLEVLILDFDKDNAKVSLGLKQITSNPWDEAVGKFPPGTRIKGKVVNIMPYGVFIELEKGIEGLLHSSEVTWQKKMVNCQEMFKLGDILEVQVIHVDKDAKRISLSMKQLEENPWNLAAGKFPVGSTIKGVVRGFSDYGAFIDLGESLEGMVHVSDMSWTKKINHPQEMLQKGQEVMLSVLSVDTGARKITLGLKQLTPNPWHAMTEKYPVGSVVSSTVIMNSNFGVFVKLEDDIEALVYSSEIDKTQALALKPGDKLQVKVIKVDVEGMKIGVSARP